MRDVEMPLNRENGLKAFLCFTNQIDLYKYSDNKDCLTDYAKLNLAISKGKSKIKEV